MSQMIVAYDPGYGNTKVCVDGNVSVLQSAVAKPKSVGNATIGMETHKATNEIVYANKKYVVGEKAWLLGKTIGNMDYASLSDESKKILFYGALSEVMPSDVECKSNLVIGLPVQFLQDDSESGGAVESLAKSYKIKHQWQVKDKSYSLKVNNVFILAQPVGAWADWFIGENLKPRKEDPDSEVAILDLGMNTLDMYVIQGAEVASAFIGGAKVGVRRLLTTMNGHGQGIEEIDYKLRKNKIHPTEENMRSWLNEVLGEVELVWPTLKRFTTIIPVGGGSMVLGDLLDQELIKKGGKVFKPENQIATNAVGLWKWFAYCAKNANRK